MEWTLNGLCELFLLFMAVSALGWCMEVALKYRQYHRFINRGFLIGPILPIYGAGVLLVTVAAALLESKDDSYGTTFVLSFLLCGGLEYFISWYLEKRFHARWWDYSTKPMNLHGRVWIGNLMLFGIAGTVVVRIIDPLYFTFMSGLNQQFKYVLAAVLAVCLATDYTVSHFVMKLVKRGVESSEADNTEQISHEIRLMLTNRSILYRRMAYAYPDVVYRTDRIRERMRELKEQSDHLYREVTEYITEEKKQLTEALTPATVIKSEIIEAQDALIEALMKNERDTERIETLKEEIADRKDVLSRKEHILDRVTDKVRSIQSGC